MMRNKDKYQRYKDIRSDGHKGEYKNVRGSIRMCICISMPSILKSFIRVFPSMQRGILLMVWFSLMSTLEEVRKPQRYGYET
jgi:hypothetical protein